jgi:adenine phosphoribosyltransferase
MNDDLKDLIRDVPDFPKPGIVFKDITPLLRSPEGFGRAVALLAAAGGHDADVVAAVEARGFILGGAIAERLGIGFVPIRKAGKLPHRTLREEYDLEYGRDSLEMHADAFASGARVLIVDDVLATGGTAEAAARLVEHAGGEVAGFSFLIELGFLEGRRRLERYPLTVLIRY